jgi:hypothetical protein
MSKISLSPDASGSGIFTIASPNSNTNRTLTLPDDTGTIVTNSGNQAGSFTTLNTSGAVVFNEAGADVDFRVEGDTDANLLFVDASADKVGIGTSSPLTNLHVRVNALSGYTSVANSGLLIERGNGPAALNIASPNTESGFIWFADQDSASVGNIAYNHASNFMSFQTNGSERARIDSSGNVGIGTTSPNYTSAGSSSRVLAVSSPTAGDGIAFLNLNGTRTGGGVDSCAGVNFFNNGTANPLAAIFGVRNATDTAGILTFRTNDTERMRITSGGGLAMVKTDPTSLSAAGFAVDVRSGNLNGVTIVKNDSNFGTALWINRLAAVGDGTLVEFAESSTVEGSISVSGTTVSYNGGNLSRWAQLTTPKDDTPLFKGTLMSNLDEMNVYVKPTLYWTEEDELPVDEEGNPTVAVGDVKEETSVSDNEQLNKVKVSDVEGDPNVAGVFVNWTYDEAHQVDEINMAMTGDMIIRIAEGVTVARGDLLMSAGDGTAKPQGDDIVRSKTIAKVTSTHVTCTYEDGSYCVPCVLMAC